MIKLGELLGLIIELILYIVCYIWVILVYYLEVYLGIIWEVMGYLFIKVIEIYLKLFNIKKLDEINLSIIGYVKWFFEG